MDPNGDPNEHKHMQLLKFNYLTIAQIEKNKQICDV